MEKDRPQESVDQMARANQLYGAVCRIMLLISSSLETGEIMRQVVVEAANAIGCESARIALRENEHWVMKYIHKLPQELVGKEFTDEELPHAALAMVTRRPVAIDDAFNDARTNVDFMRRYGIRSVLVLPLMQKEQVIGALFFNYHSAAVTFSDAEIDYAEKIAAGAAVALQNAQLFQDLKTTQRDLEERTRLSYALNEIDRTIYSTLDSATIFKKVLQQTAKAIGAESSILFSKEKGRWVVRYVYKLSQSLVGRAFSDDEVRHTAITARTKEPLAVMDAYHDSRINNDYARKLQVSSLLDFPLMVRGQVIGDLVFHYHSQMVDLGEHHVDFVRKLQNSLSLALENARLFEELKLSESRLKEAEGIGNFGYFHHDRESGKTALSDGLTRILGCGAEGRDHEMADFFRGCTVDPDADTIKQWIMQEEPADFEVVIRRQGKSFQALHVVVNSLRDQQGETVARLGTVQDVTELKLTVRELERSSAINEANLARLEAVIKSMNDGLVIADMEGNIVTFNPAAARYYGYRGKESPPKRLLDYAEDFEVRDMAGNPLPVEAWPLSRAMRRESFTNYEIRLRRRDNDAVFIGNYSGGPVLDRTGKAIYAMITMRDVTELKQAEEQLQKAHNDLEQRVTERTAELQRTVDTLRGEFEERMRTVEELREKDKMLLQQTRLAVLGEMIGNIAHQWRQPLNNIGLIAQEFPFYYEMGQLDKEYLQTNVNKIMDLVQHMSQTITDFRNFFKPDKARIPFDLRKVVESSLGLAGASLREENVELDVQMEEGIAIEGYPSEFSQVLLNIFTNARDVFKERGIATPTLRIRLLRSADEAVLTISDNAGGIPEEILDRIFDPYFTTKKNGRGTGIGLYMSKMIVETNMHGKLSVSNSEEGAEFKIEVCCVL